MQSTFVDVAGRLIHVLRTGSGSQPLLLVHGFTDSALCWQSLMEALAPDYDVIAYDSRGHGESSRVDASYTIADLADECIGVIDALALVQPIVIGHSMGAAISGMVALKAPDKIRAVVMEDPPFLETVLISVPDMQNWKSQIQMQKDAPQDAVREVYRTQLYPTWSDLDIETRISARTGLDLNVFDTMDWAASPRWQDWADQVECTGLLLTADPELGAIMQPDMAAELCSQWRTLKHIHVAGVGHHIRCGAYSAYQSALNTFLQDVLS